MKGHGVNSKTEGVRAYTVNVKFPPKQMLFWSYNMSQVSRTTEAKRFELRHSKKIPLRRWGSSLPGLRKRDPPLSPPRVNGIFPAHISAE